MNFLSPNQIASSCTNLSSCFQLIYNLFFGIFLALAFFLFLLGAFEYLLSGANIVSAEEGKRKMRNSIVALLIVLILPVIINIINPNIFSGAKILMPVLKVELSTTEPIRFAPGYVGGESTPIEDEDLQAPSWAYNKNKCLSELIKRAKPKNFAKALGILKNYITSLGSFNPNSWNWQRLALICVFESGCNYNYESKTDKCLDRNPFSIGLFQINMAVRDVGSLTSPQIDCNPNAIFEFVKEGWAIIGGQKQYVDFGSNTRLVGKRFEKQRITRDGRVRKSVYYVYNCKVKDMSRYIKCKNLLKNPKYNILWAHQISRNWTNFRPWTVYKNIVRHCEPSQVSILRENSSQLQNLNNNLVVFNPLIKIDGLKFVKTIFLRNHLKLE